MLEHAHSLGASSGVKLPNQPFFAWLKDRFVNQFLALLGLVYVPLAILYYAVALKKHGFDLPDNVNDYVLLIVDVAHIAVLSLFVVALLGILDNNIQGRYRAGRAYEILFNETPGEEKIEEGILQLRRLKCYFLCFWVTMLALYISFTFQHGFELHQPVLPEASALFDFVFPFLTYALNNLSTMFIFWCFVIMHLPSNDSTSNENRRKLVKWYTIGFGILTLLYPLLLLLVFIYHGNSIDKTTLTSYATIFEGVSGVCNAVVLALLIARLDSKLIGLPSWLIGLLYSYSAVQPLFAVFQQSDAVFKIMKTSVLIIVFGFKIYFFLIIVYALQTGRMLNYLICFPQLGLRVNSIWDNKFPPFFAWFKDRFFAWLKDRFSQVLLPLGFICISAILYIAALRHRGVPENVNDWVLLIVDAAHIAVLSLFVVMLRGILDNNIQGRDGAGRAYKILFNVTMEREKKQEKEEESTHQLRRFKCYFLCFWIAMLTLYISFTFEHGFKLHRPAHSEASALFDFVFPFLTFALNNLGMMFIFWCFLTMYLPSSDGRSNASRRQLIGLYSFGFAILTLLYPLLLIFVYHGVAIDKTTLTSYATIFEGVSGACNAVVLALLIARLDSKLISLPPGLIGFLYSYSAVQPLFAVFQQPPGILQIIQTSVLIIVFCLKICFFLIIVYALQTGRMLNFLICFPQFGRRVDSIWDNQLEVRAKQENTFFHLTIIKGNETVYTSHDRFKTIEECDAKNTELREVMKEKSSYRPGNQTGTHWVDVFNSHHHKIFHSVALKSKEEAEDLIEESMDKMPYCKYDRG